MFDDKTKNIDRHNEAGSALKQKYVWNEDHSGLVPFGDPVNIQEEIDAAAVGTRVYEVIDRVLRGCADLNTSVDWEEADFSETPLYMADLKAAADKMPSDSRIAAAEAEISSKQEAQQALEAQAKEDELTQKIKAVLAAMENKDA